MDNVRELIQQSISLLQIKIQKDTLESFNEYNNYEPMTEEYNKIFSESVYKQTKRDTVLHLLNEALRLIDQENRDGIY